MRSGITTDPLRGIDLRQDLKVNLACMKALGLNRISLLFGFAWGKHIYEGDWREIPLTPDEAQDMVLRAERQGFGELGNDNLYCMVEEYNLRLLYSHEADIHLSFAEPNRLVRDILERWSDLQWLCYSESKILAKLMGR